MPNIRFSNDADPGMRYEGLARYAFDCNRWGGPNNVAHQSAYNSLFIPEVNNEGLLVINQVLDALIERSDNEIIPELTAIKNSITQGMKQRTAIDLFDYLISIISD